MKRSTTALLCGLIALAACSQKPPLTSRALVAGSVIEGHPYYLPRSFLRISYDPEKPLDTSILLENKPDTTRGYVAEVGFSSFSADKSIIETNKSGLLETVTVDTDEQTDTIVKTLTAGVSAILSGEDVTTSTDPSTIKINLLVDPFDQKTRTSGRVVAPGIRVRTRIEDSALRAPIDNPGNAVPCPADASICVPLLVQVGVEVRTDGALFEDVVFVAHPSHVIGIKLNRRACVQTKSMLTLKEGILTKYDVDKPSEVAACLSIPLDVISAIVAAPVDALTGRQKRLDAEKNLIMSQKELLDKQQELLAAQLAAAKKE